MKRDFIFFKKSAGYTWISQCNYHNAKRFGFVHSDPEGESSQGPDTEAWEFTWVGNRKNRKIRLHSTPVPHMI
jgi:LAS superfamily LD-carboxypeptidase LdcB